MQYEKEPIYLYTRIGGKPGCLLYTSLFSNQKCVIKFIPTEARKIFGPIKYRSLKHDLYLESNLIRNFAHPNIINLYSQAQKAFLIDPFGVPFLAHFTILEFLEGRDLLGYAKKSPLTEDELRFYFIQILDSLSYLHGMGIAHQDIKSDNIVLDKTLTRAKLVDFEYSVKSDQIFIGSIRGTKEYIPPEINSMIPHDPKKADIFSLGVTIHSLVTGKFPCSEMCVQGDPIYKLICERKFDEFWKITEQNLSAPLSSEIKDLIQQMLKPSIYTRIDLSQIYDHPWLNKAKIDEENIVKMMSLRKEN